MEKIDGLNRGSQPTAMDRWERAIAENRLKNEERQGIMDRGQRAAKMEDANKIGHHECQTCASRLYVDDSNDPSVSFQMATHIPPEHSAREVMSHEMEHIRNDRAYEERNEKEVISQSVKLFTSVCPECGRVYVSGGQATTVKMSTEGGGYDDRAWQDMLDSQNRRRENPDGQVVDTKA